MYYRETDHRFERGSFRSFGFSLEPKLPPPPTPAEEAKDLVKYIDDVRDYGITYLLGKTGRVPRRLFLGSAPVDVRFETDSSGRYFTGFVLEMGHLRSESVNQLVESDDSIESGLSLARSLRKGPYTAAIKATYLFERDVLETEFSWEDYYLLFQNRDVPGGHKPIGNELLAALLASLQKNDPLKQSTEGGAPSGRDRFIRPEPTSRKRSRGGFDRFIAGPEAFERIRQAGLSAGQLSFSGAESEKKLSSGPKSRFERKHAKKARKEQKNKGKK